MIITRCERCDTEIASGDETQVRMAELRHHLQTVDVCYVYPHECREFIRRGGGLETVHAYYAGGYFAGTKSVPNIRDDKANPSD